MKKIIALLCCLFILTNTCFAFSDIENIAFSKLISELVNYGIINGYDDGTFKPEESITRAEFAKMIICATGYNYNEYDFFGDFADVSDSHWAKDYIYVSKKLGIVNGTSSTTFEPESNITYEQAIKIIVCSLGFGDDAINQGGYPDGYINIADKLGITSGISFTQTDIATRLNIALMISNILDIKYKYFYEDEGQIMLEESVITLREMHNMRISNTEDIFSADDINE